MSIQGITTICHSFLSLCLLYLSCGKVHFDYRVTHDSVRLDETVGLILDTLDKHDLTDNTMIIFISDNGANGNPAAGYPGQTEEYMNSFDNSLENRGLPNSFIDTGPGWAQASMAPSRMYKG